MQRQILRGAYRALSECQSSLRSAANASSGASFAAVRHSTAKLQGSAAPVVACPLLRSLRQGGTQVPAFPSTFPNSFAASPLAITGPLSLLGSSVQQRGLSTTDASEDGDGDDADPTYLGPVGRPQSSSIDKLEDDPPDLRRLFSRDNVRGDEGPRGRQRGQGPGPRPGGSGGGRGGDGPISGFALKEMLVESRELFIRSPEAARGALPSLPREIREAMYGHQWDRVLVDVRRSVVRETMGKREVYSAMVATGNMAGVLGLGVGEGETAPLAVARANLDSFRRLTAVPLYRGHTIYHQIDHTYHRTKMRLMPRPEGWGIRSCDLLYELCSLVGIKNISIRLVKRTKNKYFTAMCFQEALLTQTTPHDGVEATGMYIREVYYKKDLPYGLKRGVDLM